VQPQISAKSFLNVYQLTERTELTGITKQTQSNSGKSLPEIQRKVQSSSTGIVEYQAHNKR
jgi:hypothetical protein